MAEIQIKTILDTSSFDSGVKTVQAKITELENKPVNIRFTKTSSSTIANNLKKEVTESATAMQRQINAITGVDRSFKSAADSANYFKLIGKTAYEQVGAQAEALARTQAEMASSGTTAMQRQINAITGVDREFKSAADSANYFKKTGLTAFEEQSKAVDKFNKKLARIGRVIKTAAAAMLVKGLKDAVTEMKAVDAELINTAKATDASSEKMKELEQGAYRLAEAYGHTASEVLEAETAFARAGYGDKIEQMAELNLLTQNAGDLSSETASSFLLAADAAFGYEGNVQKLTAVLDGMNEVSNKNATDMSKMAEGMTVAGSVFASAGESAQTFTAMLGTATAATQRSGAEMARGLRTIFMNIRQIKGETEDGELIDGESIANAANALREFAGIDTMANGELRKGSEILAELAGKWDTLSDVQKSAIAQNVAGVRQANILLALMDNWGTYEKMMAEYANAAGSAMRENERYLEGWQAKADKLSAAWTKFVANTVSSDLIKFFLDATSAILGFGGSLGNVTLLVSGLFLAFKGYTIIPKIGVAIKALKGAFDGARLSIMGAQGAWVSFTAALGAVMVAASLITSAIGVANQKAEEHRQALLEESRSATENAKSQSESATSLLSLVNAYENAEEGSAAYKTASESLAAALGVEGSAVGELKEKYASLTQEQLKAAAATAESARIKAEAALLGIDAGKAALNYTSWLGAYRYGGEVDQIQLGWDFAGVSNRVNTLGGMRFQPKTDSAEQIIAYYDQIKSKMAEIEQQAIDTDNANLLNGNFYKDLKSAYDVLQPSVDNYLQAVKQSEEATQLYNDSLTDLTGAAATAAEAEKTKSQATDAGNAETEQAETATKNLTEEIAKHQKQLEVLKKAQQEENETGMITADTFEKIKDAGVEAGDYYVDELTGNIKMADGATQDLIDTTQEWLDAYAGRDPMDAWEKGLERAQNALARFKKELQETGERGDTLSDMQSSYSSAMGLYGAGKYGSREFQGFLEVFLSDAKKNELGNNAQKWGEFAFNEFNKGLMESSDTVDAMDYLSQNFEKNFGNMEQAGASFVKNTDGSISMFIDDMDRLVEVTGLSEDFWSSFKDSLDLYSTDRIKEENEQAAVSFEDIVTASKNAAGEIDVKEFVRQSQEVGKSTEEIADQLATLSKDKSIKMSMDIDADNAKETVEQIISDQENIGKDSKISVDASEAVTATDQVNGLKDAIDAVPRNVNIRFSISNGSNSFYGKSNLNPIKYSANAEGTDSSPGGMALVNELGPELISENGRAYIANGGEPAIVRLQPGAVVLNHIQTQKALGNTDGLGEINAYAGGTLRNWVKGLVGTVPGKNSGKSNKGSGKKANNSAAASDTSTKEDDPWKIVEDYYNYSKDLADRAKDHLDYLVDKIQNERDDLKEPLDDQIDALERVNDQLDRQATLLERERDKLTKPLQDQIDAMNDAKDIQDKQLELAEKQKAVEEARAELQNAQNERTIRYFNTEKGQWEWMADKKRVQDAQDAITSAEKDLADYQYELEIRALERQISGIEDDYKKKLDAIEEQQTANEDRIYDLEQQLQDMEDYYKAQMKPLEKQIETMERQMADYAELWAQIAITQDLPEGDLNAAINRLGNLTPEQKQSIRDIIEGVKNIQNESGASVSSGTGEIASVIQPGNTTWESALSQIGATVDGQNMHVYGDGATVYNTITNNDSHNVSYTIGSVTVQGDPSKMTVAELLESTGIYAGN